MTLQKRAVFIPFLFSLLAGCAGWAPSFYSLDVRQGNVIEQEQVDQLRPGMSKRQVQRLLGSPLIVDPFHPDRWDYVYAFYPEGEVDRGEERRLTLYFRGDVLERVAGDDVPGTESGE
ncbi:MAG: outer membrane protein assembly factor BamE [Candidatus Competibacterales bacterium]|nr:outer membrane protein assembly factor BamE [Candidatus Competibacterales bacterium]